MSPERIQGAQYTIKSDVWSLGISLVELAQGRFPFADPPDSDSESCDGLDDDERQPAENTFDPDATLPLSSQRPQLSPTTKRHRKRGVSLGGGGMTMSILDLLQHIVNEPAPRLVSRREQFPDSAVLFVDACLYKDPAARKSPQELLVSCCARRGKGNLEPFADPAQESDWIKNSKVTQADLRSWAEGVAEAQKP